MLNSAVSDSTKYACIKDEDVSNKNACKEITLCNFAEKTGIETIDFTSFPIISANTGAHACIKNKDITEGASPCIEECLCDTSPEVVTIDCSKYNIS